jgi:DNA-binding IclR family transcriptional regulator
MVAMNPEIAVLRALLRLARRRTPASVEQILFRVGVDAQATRRALASLVKAGLVHKTPDGPRLTLPGFAVAVATAGVSAERMKKTERKQAQVVSLSSRRRPAA